MGCHVLVSALHAPHSKCFFSSCLQNVWNLTDNHKKFLSLANPRRNLTALLGKQSWGISQINLCGRNQATATYMTTVHVESWVHFFHEMYLPNWLLLMHLLWHLGHPEIWQHFLQIIWCMSQTVAGVCNSMTTEQGRNLTTNLAVL